MAPRRPGRPGARRAGGALRHRPRRGRRRPHGLRGAGRRTGHERGAQRCAGVLLARVGARHFHRPPVRVVAAGAPLRRAGRAERQHGRGDRRGRREHDAGPDVHARRASPQERARFLHEPRPPGALPGRGVQPVRRRRDDGHEAPNLQGRTRRVRVPESPEGGRCRQVRRIRRGDRPRGDASRRRVWHGRAAPGGRGHPVRRHPRWHPVGEAHQGGRPRVRRVIEPDLRRRQRRS
jgi:hypothetical protein